MKSNLFCAVFVSLMMSNVCSAAELQTAENRPKTPYVAFDVEDREDERANIIARAHVTKRFLYAGICVTGTFAIASIIYACLPLQSH
jgi:hypothetical protein